MFCEALRRGGLRLCGCVGDGVGGQRAAADQAHPHPSGTHQVPSFPLSSPHQLIPPVPSLFTRFRSYLAHFSPVFSRFLRVFTVSPRRFQRAASRNPGPRNSRQDPTGGGGGGGASIQALSAYGTNQLAPHHILTVSTDSNPASEPLSADTYTVPRFYLNRLRSSCSRGARRRPAPPSHPRPSARAYPQPLAAAALAAVVVAVVVGGRWRWLRGSRRGMRVGKIEPLRRLR
eukprot:COSAG04_NODE_1131_length_8130_cov_99.963641_2_plen_231_part_00